MKQIDVINEAKKVFDIEIAALQKTKDAIGEPFEKLIEKMNQCEGKVIITGMGKSGHIARKVAATLASLGTPSFFLHPAEALHGDLGMVTEADMVIALSHSGESEEITRILPNIKMIGAKIISITANPRSTLALNADFTYLLPRLEEACYLKLAPTSSTTAALLVGDAAAVVLSMLHGFTEQDFGQYHPSGSLGKKIIVRAEDIMAKKEEIPQVAIGSLLTDSIVEMSRKGLGVIVIVDGDRKLKGILTDGDLRRAIQKKVDVYRCPVDEVMTRKPKTIRRELLAVDALQFLKTESLNNLPVVGEDGRVEGVLTWQMIIKAGIAI